MRPDRHAARHATLAGVALLLGLLAAACGGGSGGGVSGLPPSLAFSHVLGDAAPPPAHFRVTFSGDELLVGTPPGVDPASWLQVDGVATDAHAADLTITASPFGLLAHTFETTLRFVSVRRDGSDVRYADLPVVFRVGEGLSASTDLVEFTSVDGAGAPADQALTLTSDLPPYDWSVAVEPLGAPADWLTLSSNGGRGATGSAILTLRAAARPPGQYEARLVLSDGAGVERRRVTVRHTVEGVMTLGEPALFTLTQASTPADLVRAVTLRCALDPAAFPGATWTATTGTPWLTIEPSSGPLAASTPLTLRVDPSRLVAPPGADEGGSFTVSLTGVIRSPSTVPVTVRVVLPRLDTVAPRQAFAGAPTALVLRGSGFAGQATLPIRFGDQVVPGGVISDTEVRVTAPAIATPGTLLPSVDNAIGLRRDGPALQVLPQPGYQALTLDLPGPAFHLTVDPIRQAVLFTGGGRPMERLRWKDGAWSQDSFATANPSGAAVDATGQRLIVSAPYRTGGHPFYFLDAETLQVLSQPTYVGGTYLDRYDLIAPLSDGRIFAVDSDQWSYYTSLPDFGASGMIGTWGSFMLETADLGRLLFAGTLNADIFSFDVSGGGFVQRSLPKPSGPGAWAASAHGDRLLIGTAVFDRDFISRGDVTGLDGTPTLVAVSRDATRGYVLSRPDASSAWTLRSVDVSAGTGPYPAAAAPIALTLGAEVMPQALAVSADGGALFLLTAKQNVDFTFTYTFRVLPLGT